MNFLAELRTRLHRALVDLTETPDVYTQMLRPTQDGRFGDFQANCVMALAKQRGVPPRDLALQIVAALEVSDLCEAPEVAGPGFINFRLKTDRLAAATREIAGSERLGVPPVATPRNYIVDYSSPNVAKPMHVGHLRSTVIGNALYRILKFLGHDVLSDNHIGDWGTQFGMIIYGYKHFCDEAAYRQEPVRELSRLYRLVNQLSDYHTLGEELPKLREALAEKERAVVVADAAAAAQPKDKDFQRTAKKARSEVAGLKDEIASAIRKREVVDNDASLKSLAESHPQIAELARKETAKLHAGDAENNRLWHEFLPQCLAALEGMYRRLGISFDMALGESYYNPMLAGIVEELTKSGLARESDGAICVFSKTSEAPFIVRKKDGAFTYATTDLATIRYRVETLKVDSILYVVDARQSEHFALLIETAGRMGYDRTEFKHVSFGTIMGPDNKPYKTRSGDTVGLEGLLDEGVERARQIVDENDNQKPAPELSPEQRALVAETVGIGGIIYADLHHNRDSDYVFSWEKMLAKTGDTATYIQYSFARVNGIFRKGGIDPAPLRSNPPEVQLGASQERTLALQLNRFGEALADVTIDYRPNQLTQYLYETANAFAGFFENCPVLREEDEALRQSRLLLCDLTARVLKQGLELLGIGVAEQM